MKKILAIALTLTLVLALGLSASAALPAGWDWTQTGGSSDANFFAQSDGSIRMGWGSPDVYWANLGVAYDVSAFNNNYTATVEVYVPSFTKGTSTNPEQVITGAPVISVKAVYHHNAEAADAWLNGVALKIMNYQGVLGEEYYGMWGNTWCVTECFDSLAAVPASCASYADLGIKAGQWNTVKVIVEGNYVTYMVNDQIAVDGVAAASNGNYLVLGSNGDCGDVANMPGYRNLVIKSNDRNSSVADVTAFTIGAAGPADIEVVAIAGAMIVSLMAAAFVVKARKA